MLMHLSELDVPGSHSYPATGVKGVAQDARAPQSPLKPLASVLASSHSYPLASGVRTGVVVFFWGDFPYEPSIAPEVQNS